MACDPDGVTARNGWAPESRGIMLSTTAGNETTPAHTAPHLGVDTMHRTIDPAILYFGTPVVLVSTLNEDGTPNLAPMSSAWWLRQHAVLGFDPTSKTPENLLRTGECVLNLPSENEADLVDRLALLTGSDPLPPHKAARGYRTEADKFGIAGATPLPSQAVSAPRVAECPVHLEAKLADVWRLGGQGSANT
jgi:flavin reductase (DIM6/NTAB) family NADH-FMN oxidoreductase RutF